MLEMRHTPLPHGRANIGTGDQMQWSDRQFQPSNDQYNVNKNSYSDDMEPEYLLRLPLGKSDEIKTVELSTFVP